MGAALSRWAPAGRVAGAAVCSCSLQVSGTHAQKAFTAQGHSSAYSRARQHSGHSRRLGIGRITWMAAQQRCARACEGAAVPQGPTLAHRNLWDAAPSISSACRAAGPVIATRLPLQLGRGHSAPACRSTQRARQSTGGRGHLRRLAPGCWARTCSQPAQGCSAAGLSQERGKAGGRGGRLCSACCAGRLRRVAPGGAGRPAIAVGGWPAGA